ncbi:MULTISPECIES: IclR family transcriptional regulator [unclassified Microbacterium]|uniref:IclR family transcriptional regulator n=1 Tax=unclassified Microbacterium TaxID=2609290 RepID=UPI000C2BE5F8|nr:MULTISPECIES: helix-turn-helix domain-containing protein [unclassified Microbacterium]
MASAIDRVFTVLNFLATHVGQSYTLSELSRQLGLNKATGHIIMKRLQYGGYVTSTDGKFSLGPAFIPLGRAAEREFPAAQLLQQEIENLATSLGAECIASVASDDQALIVFHAGVPQPFGLAVEAGQRLPMIPPMGSAFMAWAGEEQMEEWLARLPDDENNRKAKFRKVLRMAQARGYIVTYMVSAISDMGELYSSDRVGAAGNIEEVSMATILANLTQQEYLVDEQPDASKRLANISTPIFDAQSRLLCILTLIPGSDYTAEDLPMLSNAVMRSADQVMREINGRRPGTIYAESPVF